MRYRINLHTARDDSLLGTLKYVSKTEEHQVYGALIPKEMLNEDILNSTTYQTYYAYVSGAKEPKARKFKKPPLLKLKTVLVSPKKPTKKPRKAKKDVPSTKKTVTKPKPTKKKAPVKADKGKGLNVLSDVALSEAAQLKEVTKRSKKDFHISHSSGSGDEIDFESGVPDDQQRKISGDSGENDDDDTDGNDDDEDNDDNVDDNDHERTESDKDEYPNLNQSNIKYEEEEEESERVFTPPEFVPTNDEEKIDDEEKLDEEKDDDVTKEFYKDVNVNLGIIDADMTDANWGGADQHNTEGSMKSSFISSNFTDKLLNFENTSPVDNEIASLMDFTVRHEEPSGVETTMIKIKTPPLDQTEGKKRKSSKNAESSRDIKSKESKSTSSSKGTCRSQHKSSANSTYAEEPSYIVDDFRVRQNQEFDMGNNDVQPDDEAISKSDWYKKPKQSPTPDWNKRQHVDFRLSQTWISNISRVEKPPTSFDELMDTLIGFSSFDGIPAKEEIKKIRQEKGSCYDLRYSFPQSSQNWRDLPRDILLVSVEVHRYDIKKSKSKNKEKGLTEMELVLEHTQQSISTEVLVSTEEVEELKRKVKIKGNTDGRSYWIKTSQDSKPYAHT
nr:hypothetical protein [Tanacetum cinerariifolium]